MESMNGKICLITGGSGGIGHETALVLASMGAKVIIIGRNAQKTNDAAREIMAKNNNGQSVETLVGDLSDQAEVRRLAAAFRAKYDRLDVLINNAGAVFVSRQESVDGIEMTFALNHLNYFLLTNLLIDMLMDSAPARVVNVSSGAHMGGKIHFDDIEYRQNYSSWGAYSQSKLANVMFSYELSRRITGKGVAVNALHPGFVATNFGRSNGGIFNPLFRLSQFFAISPQQGAQTSTYLASSPEVEGVTGQYFDRCKSVRSAAASYDQAACVRLWEISAEMTKMSMLAAV